MKTFNYSASIVDFNTGELIHQPTLAAKLLPRPGFIAFPLRMLVDSGGQETLIEAKIGEAIGIDIESGPQRPVGGITGGTIGYDHQVQIELPELGDTLDVLATFVPNMGTSGLLGQIDFFPKYEVIFKANKLKFSISKVPVIKF